jgi:hypothetical protein
LNAAAAQRRRARAHPARSRARQPAWVHFDDERLLDLRLCDLELRLEDTPLVALVERLHAELAARRLRFRPHCWLSSDWFSPDGVPGIAIPFFLAHQRLARLERSRMHSLEGGSVDACMKLLRHEAGHALDSAYRLHDRKSWREMFGAFSTPYAAHYRPQPYSREYVQHLPHWYAQSHPAEDFAETFAVWLPPGAQWRRRYRSWPALLKLEHVERTVASIAGLSPRVANRERTEHLGTLEITLRHYYRDKRARYAKRFPYAFDRDLRRMFSRALPGDRRHSAAAFLREQRTEMLARIAKWSGEHSYTIDQVLRDMIARARELRLVVDARTTSAKLDAAILLAVHTMNYLHTGYHRLAR